MARITRLNPWRSVDENDVINLFSLDANTGEAGALVRVSNGNMSEDVVSYVDDANWTSPLGHARSQYPVNPLKVTKVTATGQAGVLGIMLRDVRSTDENGELLKYYSVKKDELQCVISGETVPVATRGIFEVNSNAFANGLVPAVGSLAVPAVNGQLTGVAVASATAEQKQYAVGIFLATGNRVSQQDTDAYAGGFAILKLDIKSA